MLPIIKTCLPIEISARVPGSDLSTEVESDRKIIFDQPSLNLTVRLLLSKEIISPDIAPPLPPRMLLPDGPPLNC